MENSLNKRCGIKRSLTQSDEVSATIKKEPLDEDNGHIKEPRLDTSQQNWDCSSNDPLKLESETGDADETSQDPFFMVEALDIKAEDEEMEDNGDGGVNSGTPGYAVYPDIRNIFSEVKAPSISRKTTSNEDRRRIIAAIDQGYSTRMIAEMLCLNRTTVHSIMKKYWKTGESDASKRGGAKPKKLTSEAIEDVHSWVDEDCTITLKKISQKIFERHAIRVSPTTIGRALQSFNFSFKRIKIHPDRVSTVDAVEERKENAFSHDRILHTAVVFIGEVTFNIAIRSLSDKSLVGTADRKVVRRYRNISIACAMNRSGMLHYIAMPRVIKQEVFNEFVAQLKNKLYLQNDDHLPLLIMDNAAFPKCTAVHETITAEGFEVNYLPTDSTCLNPIENFFNNFKNIVNRAKPESEQELIQAIQQGATLIRQQDCEDYFSDFSKLIEGCTVGEENTD